MMRILFALALLAPLSIPTTWSARERAAAEAITPQALAAHTRFLADDLLEGRAPGSRGGELAVRYIASELERLGLQPAGDGGGYLQRFQLIGLKSEAVLPPMLRAPSPSVPPLVLKPGGDSVVVAGLQAPRAKIDGAEVVFVGYGIAAPEQKWDDFKDVDLRGKVLLVMNNDPAHADEPTLFGGNTRLYYGRWTYKYEEAARRGAVAAIVIHTTPSAGYPWQVVQSSWSGEDFELPAGAEPRLAAKLWVTEEAARQIAKLGGRDLDQLRGAAERRDFRPVGLGVRFSVELKTQVRRLETANVVARLPGSDPALAAEAVVYSAHHDHLGVREPKNGDAIYNGALDNASGVATLLTIAEGLRHARPRRSVLFAAVGGEESGLLGSEYFCAHPPLPAGRIAANLNIDGINIWGRTRDVSSIGLGKSSLDQVVEAVARSQGRVVKADPFPDRGHFYRSDQFSFARVGVPAVYLDNGVDFVGHDEKWGRERVEEYEQKRYHQPSDQIDDSWNLDGAVDDARLLAVVGLRVADALAMPAWRPGDEFEAARRKALDAVTRRTIDAAPRGTIDAHRHD